MKFIKCKSQRFVCLPTCSTSFVILAYKKNNYSQLIVCMVFGSIAMLSMWNLIIVSLLFFYINVHMHCLLRPLCHLPLKPAHCRARMRQSLVGLGWNDADWGSIVFSDEFPFYLCWWSSKTCLETIRSPFRSCFHNCMQTGPQPEFMV